MATYVVGVGCDVQGHEPVREAWLRHGPRYLQRVLAPSEDRQRHRMPDPAGVAELAARFAVKEAVVKCLRLKPHEPLPWSEIAVDLVLGSAAAPLAVRGIALTGRALEHARAAGITQWKARLVAPRPSIRQTGSWRLGTTMVAPAPTGHIAVSSAIVVALDGANSYSERGGAQASSTSGETNFDGARESATRGNGRAGALGAAARETTA